MPGYQNRCNRINRCRIPVTAIAIAIAIAFHTLLPHMLTPSSFCLLTGKASESFPDFNALQVLVILMIIMLCSRPTVLLPMTILVIAGSPSSVAGTHHRTLLDQPFDIRSVFYFLGSVLEGCALQSLPRYHLLARLVALWFSLPISPSPSVSPAVVGSCVATPQSPHFLNGFWKGHDARETYARNVGTVTGAALPSLLHKFRPASRRRS